MCRQCGAAACHFENSASGGNRQTGKKPVPGGPNDRTQLAAVAGLQAEQGEMLTLDEPAAVFFANPSDWGRANFPGNTSAIPRSGSRGTEFRP